MGKQLVTIIIQTTSLCNLRCGYCYCQSGRDSSDYITFENFRKCLSRIDGFFDPHYEICVLFHGGEPLLLGANFYKEAFRFLRGLRHKYHTGVQTNLTLLNDDFIQLFQENNCRIGTSLDGDSSFHDFYRKYNDGKGSYEKVNKKIKTLQGAGVKYGIVSVINDYNIQSPIEFYSFLKEHTNTSFRLSPMFMVKNNRICAVNPKALGNFLTLLYDFWIADEHPPEITLFKDVINNFLMRNYSQLCTFHADCCQVFFTLDWDGNVYPCCHFVGNQAFCYGNLLESPFSAIFNSSVRFTVSQRTSLTEKLCQGCEFYEMCFSGCMANTINGIYNKDYFCHAYKILFEHIKKSLDEFLKQGVTNVA